MNISGRAFVQTNDKAAIAGFIVRGSGLKRVIVRGMGPSLRADDKPIAGAMQDPVLELRDSNGGSATNDNWRTSQESDIEQTGLAPSDDRESAILISLPEGNYTAIVRGHDDSNGVALAEVYDLGAADGGQLANLSLRADVETDDQVLIDGVIVRGDTPKRVVFRALGPSLHAKGVNGELQDPTLELHNGDGALLMTNDNWRDGPDASEIEANGLAPSDDRESALMMTLGSGNYTTIVRGVNRTTGVALAEAYKLD